ncbi:MAG: CDP-glycerol glycerophosphotransferase family protein [Lachnospiraceae bacterium]|nr:CDP-glycerol glycerophosphotransferase family protein [Lachnospiraceae bacterium]
MALKKLTNENINSLSGKQICLYERSVSYLEELCSEYDVLKSIRFIVDGNERNRGQLVFHDTILEVYDLSHLKRINLYRMAILIISDYYIEAYTKIMDILGAKNAEIDIFYYVNRETKYADFYREKYADEPLKDILLFRSGPHASSYIKGMDFADNARALFEYAMRTGVNHQYELVWFVKNPAEFEKYSNMENVSFLPFNWSVSANQEERDAYYRVLSLAKYIFFTDAYGFARNCRNDQIRVQLWHGCGFKTRVNFVRCEKRYEYTTVISDLYAKIHADIYGLRKEQVLVTGYAKQDWLFHPNKEDIRKLYIPDADKYIFWLPTFRSAGYKLAQLNEYNLESETGLPIVDTKEKMDYLNALLAEKNIVLIVKLHPFQDRNQICCENCSNIRLIENEDLVEQDIPINRLLGHADALLSDYSSAAVDFMLLDRPIAFMLDDLEEYRQSRGFIFENIREWIPGKEIFALEDVCDFVEEIANGCDTTAERRRMLRDRMHKYCDDNNCQRILEVFGISHGKGMKQQKL